MQKFNQNNRRMLTFPAVHPCEAISPATLLNSLLTISNNICNHQSKLFPTQRRNIRETIRQIRILLIFFQEIQNRRLILPDSVTLCFCELHITFQKIQFLLEDCSRKGAKLWILMKSQFVMTQLRILIRTIATVLDVLPLNSIAVCSEVIELVELVAKQARKAKIELDSDDEQAMNRVVLILNRFEKGIEPDVVIVKSILHQLDIRSWRNCNNEIDCLEEEIIVQYSNSVEKEAISVSFLSGLIGFMSYCRGVMFEEFDHQMNDEHRCNIETPSCVVSNDFRCPISLELMNDPVTIVTGQTYDRCSIQKWFKAGNTICPKTGEKVTTTDLIPNTTLKKLIRQFCEHNGVSVSKSGQQTRDLTKTIVPRSSSAAESMKLLSRFLTRKIVFGTNKEKNKAAYETRLLTKSNIYNRSCLIEAGILLPLLNLLSSNIYDRSTQENAIAALLKLSKHTTGKKTILEIGGLKPILAVLRNGLSSEAKQIAAATVFYLSTVKGYPKIIGETRDAIPSLVELIKNGTTCGKKNAVVAVFALLMYRENHKKVLEANAVEPLLDILSSEKTELVADSLAVLATLAEKIDGSFAIMKTSGSLRLIVGILSRTSRAGKEYSVSMLVCLCRNIGDEVIGVLSKDHSLTASLYSLVVTDESKKARSLIKILHEFEQNKFFESRNHEVV